MTRISFHPVALGILLLVLILSGLVAFPTFLHPATAVLPGGYAVFFPPYFMPGLILTALALAQTLLILFRWIPVLTSRIPLTLAASMNLIIAAVGIVVLLSLAFHYFSAWQQGWLEEQLAFCQQILGYPPFFYVLWAAPLFASQLLWWKKIRNQPIWSLAIALSLHIGLWMKSVAGS